MGAPGITVSPDGVHLLTDSTGRASGEAFVHFNDKGSAQQALTRDREKIGHRWGALFLARGLVRVWLAILRKQTKSFPIKKQKESSKNVFTILN